jgi:hypothetical protein
MTDRIPKRIAEKATPWAWFPAEHAIIPFDASSAFRLLSLL